MYREAVLPSPIYSYRRGHRRRRRGEATEKIVTLKVKRVRAGGENSLLNAISNVCIIG
jgi:hypothetical protein